jgi:DMSO reductase anchor subunit
VHPAPSLILFSSLSGLGLGLLAWLGVLMPVGWAAFWAFALGFVLAGGGFLASTFHLLRRSRAHLAFTQWRSSWLSREAILAVGGLGLMAVHAALLTFRGGSPLVLGLVAGALCLGTVFATAMIYAQMRSIPRWRHWSTPALFLALTLAGGALVAGPRLAALGLLVVALGLQLLNWRHGREAFRRFGATMNSATGLQGDVRSFLQPHTGPNYLLREMVYVVGRRRAGQLRLVTLVLAFALPAGLLLLGVPGVLAAAVHLAGVLCSRWLFFAEAEHVVGLYYGAR